MHSLRALVLVSLFVSQASCFAGFDPALIHHSVTSATSALDSLIHHHHHHHVHHTSAAQVVMTPAVDAAQHLLQSYKQSLATHPLPTKMMTGATLAMAGDAIAQSKEDAPYDVRRAASFGAFDMAYRALQHVSFPLIVEHCRGQFLTAGITAVVGLAGMQPHAITTTLNPELTNNLAAMEQTLASQLGIVPFLYYPVFFGMTGFIQGLSLEGSIERAQEKFVPLMKRNLLFWIPVQFIQFGFIEENLQIPFLSVCGLAWTFILSIMAGSTKTYQSSTESAVDSVAVDPTEVNSEDAIFQEQLASAAVDQFGAAITMEEQEATSTSSTAGRPGDFVMELAKEDDDASYTTATTQPREETLAYERR